MHEPSTTTTFFPDSPPSPSFASSITTQSSLNSTTSSTSTATATHSFHRLSKSSRNLFAKAPIPSLTTSKHIPKRYRVTAGHRTGLLHNLRKKPCSDVVVYHRVEGLDCVIIGVGRGYGDAKGDADFVERGLDQVVNIIGRGLKSGRVAGIGGLEALVEQGWIEACCWVEQENHGWRKGFGGVVGVMWKGFWCCGGVGTGRAVKIGRSGGEWNVENVGDMHDVWNLKERERVERFGARVEGSRVLEGAGGGLEVTRCCGCARFRKCGVVGVPWVRGGKMGRRDKGLVVSTVPIMGKEGPEEGVRIFRETARKKKGSSEICRKFLDAAEGGIPKMEDMAVACAEVFW